MTRFFISSIWFIVSSGLLYNFFFYSDTNTIAYDIACWAVAAPLAGFIFVHLVSKMENDKKPFCNAGIVGFFIAIPVSIIDFIAFSQNFGDFLCDVIEIGFGFFAVFSYFLGRILQSIFDMYDLSEVLEQNKKVKEEKLRGKENEIIVKAIKFGLDALSKKELDVYIHYSFKHGDPIKKHEIELRSKVQKKVNELGEESLLAEEKNIYELIKKERETLSQIIAKADEYGVNRLNRAELEIYKKYKEQERKKAEAEANRVREEVRSHRLQKNLPSVEESFLETINNGLKDILDEGKGHLEYMIFGGKGFEERYFANEYPVTSLKLKTRNYARKVAIMNDSEIRLETMHLLQNNAKEDARKQSRRRDFENLKKQKIHHVDDRGTELLIYNQAGSLIGGIKKLSNEKLLGYTPENISTRSGDYIFCYNNIGEKISTQLAK